MRRRLILGAAYVLLVVIVGLTVPFAQTLARRLTEELGGRVEREAFAVGAALEDELETGNTAPLQPAIVRIAERIGGRVLLTDAQGILLADSLEPPGAVPPSYATRPEVGTALAGEPNWQVRPSASLGYDILVSAVPIRTGAQVIGVVRISYGMEEVREAIHRSWWFLALIGGATLAIGLALAAWLARWATKPLKRAAAVAQRISEGDLDARVPEEGPPEVAELARDLNLMTDHLGQLLEANRGFAANASHQLRTPLAALRLRLEEALAGPDPREEMQKALDQVDRLTDLVDGLLKLGQTVQGDRSRIDVAEIARTIAAETGDGRIVVGGAGHIVANLEGLRALLENLIDNARRFAREHVEVNIEQRGRTVVVSVGDDGPGIPNDERERVFDRFFRGRSSRGKGSGLGLAIAADLARADGGRVTATTSELGGARLDVVYASADREEVGVG